jgi:hypothetical protein
MRSFTISTTADRVPPRRWFTVRIHPSVEDLRTAAARHRPDAEFGDCCGCVHPVYPPGPGNGYAGLIRLADEYATPEIVAHELLHAAVVVYRMNVRPDVRLGFGCHGREEQLAYIYGELFASFQDCWYAGEASR